MRGREGMKDGGCKEERGCEVRILSKIGRHKTHHV